MIKERIITAYILAKKAHLGQKRKYSNLDYFTHCKAVARRIEELNLSEDMIISALLHDTIEDTAIEYETIEKEFGIIIANIVNELTSDKYLIKKIGKANYLGNKMLNMSEEAFTLKLADREHNIKFLAKDSDLSSLKAMKFLKKYYTETCDILNIISKRYQNNSQAILFNSINDILEGLSIKYNLEYNTILWREK